jgi:biopolymer transport protein ExbD
MVAGVTGQTDWWMVGGIIAIIGAAVVALWSICSIISVERLVRGSRELERDGRTRTVVTNKKISPFSWMKTIVLSEEELTEGYDLVVAHERAHIRLLHSWDVLFMNLCCSLQWFNPAVWLLRRDLREVHEYEADMEVLLGGVNVRDYQLLLIKKAVGNKSYSIANSLNHSTLKNRITMMLHKKSTPASRMRVLCALPLVCLSLTAFAQTETVVINADKVTENSHENQTRQVTTLRVVDGKVYVDGSQTPTSHYITITLGDNSTLLNGKEIEFDSLAEELDAYLQQEGSTTSAKVVYINMEEGVKMEQVDAVKNTLREAKLYRIYYDTTPQSLPPLSDSGDTVTATVAEEPTPFMLVDDRNIMTIVLQKNNKVKLTMGGESFEVGADDNKVRWAIKTFVKNAKESPTLPSKRTTVITLPSGGKSLEYQSSNGMITIKADAEADAKEFSSLNAAIYAAYGELREEAANELFGRSLSELTPEEQDAIHKAIPIRVAETSTAKHLSK